MAKKRTLTDIHEPNAGNDFHLLWAVGKCLDLLNFSTDGLQAVSIESLDAKDTEVVDATGDTLLGVDLTEYYGGLNFRKAKRIVISQLKYSTKHSTKTWTAAEICSGKKSGTKGSIIDRLATTFKELTKEFGAETTVKKTSIKLVSNRTAIDALSSLSSKAKILIENSPTASIAALKKKLNAQETNALERIGKASELSGKLLLQFLAILDFNDCSASSRELLKQDSIKSLADLGMMDAQDQLSILKNMVWDKAMPETKKDNTLTKENILYAFKFPDLQSMFPVPSRFENLRKTVEREQTADVVKLISESAGKGPICLHGPAGIGKSTFAKNIDTLLPADSESILFDCYGGGTYLDPDDQRHLHQVALLYLCNELALKTGCPFLVNRVGDKHYFIKQFSSRIASASAILEKRSKNAVLAIIIDAADNSVTAAMDQHEMSFVPDIVKLPMPKNVRLIVTARSHRVPSLELPDEYVDYALLPFTENETGKYLQIFFPSVTTQETKEFRELSQGIPRVMAYTMEAPGSTLKERLKPLKPKGKNLDAIFKVLLKEAEKKSGDKKMFRKVIKHLVVLPRPIPVKYVLQTTGATKEFLSDTAFDLWKGLVFEHNIFRFKDEDFETFLKAQYPSENADFTAIADFFLSMADKEDYASSYLGRFLYSAGRQRELETIVLERKHGKFPTDPIRNREVFIERARLSMQSATLEKNNLNFLKLQVVASEASKANSVLEDVMTDHPELATLFGNSQSNKRMYFKDGNPKWFGRVHLRSAAVLSRDPATIEQAREHLKSAQLWFKYRNSLDDRQYDEYAINSQDIACGAEAKLRMDGPQECINWMRRGRPKDHFYGCIRPLVENLLANATTKEISGWCAVAQVSMDVSLLINQICFENGLPLPFDINNLAKKVIRLFRIRSTIKLSLWETVISLAEQLLFAGAAKTTIKKVLRLFAITGPDTPPSFYESKVYNEDNIEQTDIYLRYLALKSHIDKKAIKVDDVLPLRLKKINPELKAYEKERQEKDKKKFQTYYKHLLPCYQLIAKGYGKAITRASAIAELKQILVTYDRDYEIGYHYEHESRKLPNFLSVKLLDLAFIFARPEALVSLIGEKLFPKRSGNISLLYSMADRLSLNKTMFPAALKLLDQADKIIAAGTFSAKEQMDFYLRSTFIGTRISKATGKEYFDKAILASKDIDVDAIDQVRAMAKLVSELEALNDSEMAFNFARYVEYVSEKLKGYDDFPWNDAVEGIGKMDPLGLLAISCRWDHRTVRRFGSDFPEMLVPAINSGMMDYRVAASLLPLNNYYWDDYARTVNLILSGIHKNGSNEDKQRFLGDLFTDLKLHCTSHQLQKTVHQILSHLNQINYTNSGLYVEMKTYYQKLHKLIGYEADSREKPDKKHETKKKAESRKLLKGVVITDSVSIETFLAKHRAKSDEFFDFSIYGAVDAMFDIAKPAQYVKHLDALVDLPASSLDSWTFHHAIEQRLEAWGLYPEICQWKKANFEKIVRTRFFHYIKLDSYYEKASIYSLAQLCGVDNVEIGRIISEALPDHVNELTASSIIKLLQITAAALSKEQRIEFCKWLVNRWIETIRPDFADGVYTTEMEVPYDPVTVPARFLRYYLGHPDKRLRWKAAKSIIRLVQYNNLDILVQLVREQNLDTCVPFQNKGYLFFKFSAKVWLYITLHKLAIVEPAKVIRFANDIYAQIGDGKEDHAQILLFAKAACLQLEESFPGTFTAERLANINQCLVSQLPEKTASGKVRRRTASERTKFRFEFDTYNTIDHWFDPLGDRFDLGAYEVAAIVEKIICDEWGFTGDVREQDYGRNSPDRDLGSHYKHEIPIIEDLRDYLEYNGMQSAAGKLIKTKPLIKDASYYSSWNEWIDDIGLIWPDVWLGDMRDPVPPEPTFWNEKRTEGDWQWNIMRKDLDALIGFAYDLKNNFIVLKSDITIYTGKDYEQQTVSSALVKPELAPSLLRAVQTMNRHDFSIPSEGSRGFRGDDDDDENDIPSDQFKLVPWIVVPEVQHEGVDKFDDDTYNLDKFRFQAGTEFKKWGNLIVSPDMRFSGVNGNFTDPATILETWSNAPRKPSYSSYYTYGQRLFFKVEMLLKFLKENGRVLLINSEIYRRPEKKEFDEELSYYNMFYLIYPDGKVATLARDFKIR